MRINISYTPSEEAHVNRLVDFMRRLFPAATVKHSLKAKFKHCYIDTGRKAAKSHNM